MATKIHAKFYLRRVYPNSAGYLGSDYFGIGEPLYYFTSTEPIPWFQHHSADFIAGHIRGDSREEVRAWIREKYRYTLHNEPVEISFFR